MHLRAVGYSWLADCQLLAEWARKVDWKQGGTAARPAGKPPKAPVTALEAYVQYLRSQTQKAVRAHAPDKEEQHTSVAILKVSRLWRILSTITAWKGIFRNPSPACCEQHAP